jgi:8-oxo-dGTP diphosphatase
VSEYKNPSPAVDAVIFYKDMDSIILIWRKNPPIGWSLPGGFVNEGENLEQAVKREVREELGIEIVLLEQFFTYSEPERDPRKHVMSTVFVATTTEKPIASDDAIKAEMFKVAWILCNPPQSLSFDHSRIIRDVHRYITTGERRKLE